MFIVLKDSTIRVSEIVAVTKSTILATLNTPEYYAMNVYLKNIPQPIVHVYTDEEERQETYTLVLQALQENEIEN